MNVDLEKTEIWDIVALITDRATKSTESDDYNYWVKLGAKIILVPVREALRENAAKSGKTCIHCFMTIHSSKDGVPWRRDDNGWYLCYASPDGLHEPQ